MIILYLIRFFFRFSKISEPFQYEALLDDYLDLGISDAKKDNRYAPVYPIFRTRPPKQRQQSQRFSESSSSSLSD